MKLFEHYVTIWNNKNKEKDVYLEQVWSILQNSYEDIGGLKGIDKNRLMQDNIVWKLVRRNDTEISAVCIYNTRNNSDFGRKMIACGSLFTDSAKIDLYKICSEDVKMVERNTWAEVSGAMEHIYLCKYNGIPIPNSIAMTTLSDLHIEINYLCNDGFHYVRKLNKQGDVATKMLFGNIPKPYRTTNWTTDIDEFRHDYKTNNSYK